MEKLDLITKRILKKIGIPHLIPLLQQLSPTDLQSLFIRIFQKVAIDISPKDLLKAYEQNRFVQASSLDPLQFLAFDQLAFKHLPDEFTRMELSPIAPLGTCSTIATVNQDKVLSALRHTEVVADCTNVLALECAKQRKALLKQYPKSNQGIKLACSHRLTRTQALAESYHTATFRLFCLVSAGKDEGNFQFEIDNIREHFDFYIRFIQSFLKAHQQEGTINCLLTPLREDYKPVLIQEQIFDPLSKLYPEVTLKFYPERTTGRGYYQSFSFIIQIVKPDGSTFDIIDGGLTDWTQQLVGSKKERLLISAMGSEMMLKIFGN